MLRMKASCHSELLDGTVGCPYMVTSAVMHCCECRYQKCAKLADAMEKGLHYTVDEKQKSILLTEDGYETAEDILGVSAWLH